MRAMARTMFWACSSCLVMCVVATDRPIIGVLAQELPAAAKPLFPDKSSYIPAAYVKAVEAAGARAAPIFINRTDEYYKYMMMSVNGLVLPGGGVNFLDPQGFAAAGRIVMNIAFQLQDSGVSFPVLGVCQGYELLMFLAANTTDILEDCAALNTALPLHFLPGALDSRLFRHAPLDIVQILQTLPVTSNHHKECVTRKRLKSHYLDKTWRVLTTNLDNNGLEFISSSEHFHRPVVGVQFHPEKNMYEWNPDQANPHSRKAVLSARYFYDWLVEESRRNDQRFPSVREEEDNLMYNYSPIYTGRNKGYDEQTFIF